MRVDFTKMTGAGNDFVLIDGRRRRFELDWAGLAPVLCNRRYGIGADGLLIIEESGKGDFSLKYFNSDGSYGGMCGNGGRCAARYIMDELNKSEISFEALDYLYHASSVPPQVKLRMMDPKHIYSKELQVLNHVIPLHFLFTGTDH